MDVGEVVARLYGGPPEDFVATRAEAVARARAAGDRELAAQLGALRKPTVAAWLVNLLAHHRPDLVGGLLSLAGELREAQRELRGPQLRELSVRRRDTVTALVRAAAELAAGAGRTDRDKLPLAEVEQTLNAALSDQELAAEVRAGRLTRPLEYAGFGETPRPQLRLLHGGVTGPEPEPAGEPSPVRPRTAAGRTDRPTVDVDPVEPPEMDEGGSVGTGEKSSQESVVSRRKQVKAARRGVLEASTRLANARSSARAAQVVLDAARAKLEAADQRVAQAEEQVRAAQERLDEFSEEDLVL